MGQPEHYGARQNARYPSSFDWLERRVAIRELWRCLGEASAWAAYKALADDEGTWGPVSYDDGVRRTAVRDEVGTPGLRKLLGVDDA